MKTKINNPIRKLIFSLFVFLTVIGCQKETDDTEPQNIIDDNPVSNEYQNRNLDIKVSGYSDFQNDSNFNSIINGLSLSGRIAGNNTANRTGDNDVNGFTIDTTEIRQVQFDGYTSYTFKVYREESVGLFENLVVEVNDEGERAYIASYIPDQQYLDDISNGIISEFNGTVRIENISSNTSNRNSDIANRSGCGSYYVIVETQCPCVGHWPGQSCECGTQPSTTWYTFDYPCDDGGGYTEGPIGPRGGGGGGGTPTNDDSVTSPIIPTDSDGNSVAPLFLINALGGNSALTNEQVIWINDPINSNLVNQLLASYPNSTQYGVTMALSVLMNNPNISWTLIEDWFLNKPDYTEPNLNIDPNNITYSEQLTQQSLPSLDDFVDNFPKLGTSGNYYEMPTSQVYQLVGGSLWTSHQNQPESYSNACSIRGSRGLLYSGIDIPVLNYPGLGQRTQKGGDNENYILDAVSFDKYMRDKFGAATYELTGTDANDPVQVANLLSGKNGIYVIINSSHNQAGYSGHVDAIIDGDCVSNAYTTPSGGVKSIRIWELN